jgi:hypothetical protein
MIASINFSLFPSNELLTFANRGIALFEGKNLEGTGLAPFYTRAIEASAKFANAFERESKNPYTKVLYQKDSLRDEAFLSLRTYVEACSHRNIDGWPAATQKILETIRKHGWSAFHLGYKAETAALSNLVSELKNKCNAELTLIKASELIGELEAAQKSFETSMQENIKNGGDENNIITATRPVMVHALKSLFMMVGLQYEATANPIIGEFEKNINELIVLSMSSLKAAVTNAANQKAKETTEKAEAK